MSPTVVDRSARLNILPRWLLAALCKGAQERAISRALGDRFHVPLAASLALGLGNK
jgi:hypothetical protein